MERKLKLQAAMGLWSDHSVHTAWVVPTRRGSSLGFGLGEPSLSEPVDVVAESASATAAHMVWAATTCVEVLVVEGL